MIFTQGCRNSQQKGILHFRHGGFLLWPSEESYAELKSISCAYRFKKHKM